MFYSQFILAKKGPLGTIWIAAHLERKLRKNQVADTDIGVSVDSILFPDAPIALRLSSHLLLGVVRIYSKKVNYLFNDCSEALIKIKHAFRSTAVDLPPEESTAPYNSITLPENFDLDNFELPDSACLDSNFVDHHVSTREQITLQDTINDTAYPTVKFGLDERFGDEDVSQIGLELDEEIFMDKKISPQQDEISMSLKASGLDPGETSVPLTSMGMDAQFGYDEEKGGEIPNELSELLSNNYDKNYFSNSDELRRDANSSRHGYTIQTPDLNEVFQPERHTDSSPHIPFSTSEAQTSCLVEPTHEPSTSGLLEAVPSKAVPDLSSQEKVETHTELGRSSWNTSSAYLEVESIETGRKTIFLNAENVQEIPINSVLNPMPGFVAPTYSTWNPTTDDVCLISENQYQQSHLIGNEDGQISTTDRRLDNGEVVKHSGFSNETISLASPLSLTARFEEERSTSNICADNMDVSSSISNVKLSQKDYINEASKVVNIGHIEDVDSCVTRFVAGSEYISRPLGSSLHPNFVHGISSGFLHETISLTSPSMLEARFEAAPTTSSICTYKMDVSGGISEVKKTQTKNSCIGPSEFSNLGHVEVVDSCISSQVVDSDFLSRSSGSTMRPIFLHGDPSEFSNETANVTPPLNKLAGESVTSSVCTDNIGVFGGISDMKSISKKDSNVPSKVSNLGHVEDGDFCMGTSAAESDCLPNSCGSNLSPILLHSDPSGFSHGAVNLTAPPDLAAHIEAEPATSNICTDNMDVSGDFLNGRTALKTCNNRGSKLTNLGRVEDAEGALGEVSRLPFKDHQSFHLKTPSREEVLHNTRSSFEVQGDDLRYTNNDRTISPEEKHIPRFSSSDIKCGPNKHDESSMGAFSKVTHLNNANFSSSSEILGQENMLAPTFVVNAPNYQGLQTVDTLSDASVDRNSGHYSRKRGVMDSPILTQSGSSAKLSGIPRSKRSVDYIPADDDVLASLLAGRSAPSMEIGSIPSLSKVSSQKRPRTISRVGMHKRRKVLVDEAMVLHADAIRQQLINTEDIRRMRKKAPCTRPEIWKICIGAKDDDIFDHSILTGLTVELNNLHDLNYSLQKDPSSLVKEYRIKTSGETRSSKIEEILNEPSVKEMNDGIPFVPGPVYRNEYPSSKTAFDTMQTHEDGAHCVSHDQLKNLDVPPKVCPINNEQESVACAMQPDTGIGANSINQELLVQTQAEPISNEHESVICTLPPDAETGANLIIQELPVLPLALPINSEEVSMTYVMRPNAETGVNSIVHEEPIPENDKRLSSFGKFNDQSINLPEKNALPSDACNSLRASNDVSGCDECTTIVRTDGDLAFVPVFSGSHIQVENVGNTVGKIINKLRTDTLSNADGAIINEEEKSLYSMDTEHSKPSYTFTIDGDASAVVNVHANMPPDSGTELLLEKTNGSDVIADSCSAEALGNEERPVKDVTFTEPDKVTCASNSVEVSLAMDGNSCVQDINFKGSLHADNMLVDAGASRDSSDFCSSMDVNCTGFLNEDDDDEDFDDADNDDPNPEDDESLENGSWSVRTRGVAKYLKNLFDEESGQGRKSVVVDHILAGKTRKEASRMFFETLVLKTRDYVQVEQEKPFEYIQIKPRIKLLKSEF